MWQPREHGVVHRRFGQFDGKPAHLCLARGVDRRVCGLGEQLCTQTDSEHRSVQAEQPMQEEVLLPEPRMVQVLIRVHRAAEHEHRAVGIEGARQRRVPRETPFLEPVPALGDHVAEHARAHAFAVYDREDVHLS